jgi:hypothetical protein
MDRVARSVAPVFQHFDELPGERVVDAVAERGNSGKPQQALRAVEAGLRSARAAPCATKRGRWRSPKKLGHLGPFRAFKNCCLSPAADPRPADSLVSH